MSNFPDPVIVSDPASWWRRLCRVTDQLHLCGDLPHGFRDAKRDLKGWVAAGVTHIVDVRGEYSDQDLVVELQPQMVYAFHGTHDNGGPQAHAWFDGAVDSVVNAIQADPQNQVVVHCHMGVNRAPSLAFAALLVLGHGITEALTAIRTARPIARILYADSAVQWFGDREGWSEQKTAEARQEAKNWHKQNPVDAGWVISRIRKEERVNA